MKRIFRYIKVQIAFYYLLASLLLVAIFGVGLYYSISTTLLNEALQTTATAVDHSGKYIEVYIDRLKALASIIVENPDTMAYLSGEEEKRADTVALINSVLSTDDFLQSVTIVGKEGQVISNESALDMTMSSDMMDESWYRKAINAQMPVLTSARMQDFSMDKEHWVISISQEIKDESGDNLGVLLIDIKYSVLESYFEGLDLGDEGMVFILNENNEVVYHKDTLYFSSEEKKEALIKIASMTGYEHEMGILTHQYQLSNADWILVGVSGLDSLDIIQRQVTEMAVLIGIILMIIALLSGVLIAERITRPIKALEEAMGEMKDTVKSVDIDYSGSYEAEQLTKQFNYLMERIGSLMKEVSENEKYLREYEIKALHSQINPHFLYNTLDTIVWMAEFDDSESVIAVTKSLASFFRISLSKGEEMIPLKDEVEHVRQYLFIQKQRYQEKLTYEIDFDENLSSIKVPKILLQPIAENALYHGIREKEGPGRIQITVKKVEDYVVMTVVDDGIGFDLSDKKKKNGTKLGGVGIENVRQRLALYYGESKGLEMTSKIGEGTTVKLYLKED